MQIAPKPGFDWRRVVWSAPHARQPEVCSYCGGALPGEEDPEIPLRLWNDAGWAAAFCVACMQTWWGFEPIALEEGIEIEAGWPDDDEDP